MEDWKQVLAKSIVKPKDLAERFGLDAEELEAIVGPYPLRITPTVLGTIKAKGDAIWKQVIPEQMAELAALDAEDDPLEEDLMSPVPHLRRPGPAAQRIWWAARSDQPGSGSPPATAY